MLGMSTWNGIGTTHKGFSYLNLDGSHYATEWAVLLFLPVVPLRRHRLTLGESTYTSYGNGSTSVTQYAIHEETPLVGGEILRTYLIWWLLGPLIICGPLALAVWWLNSDNDAGVIQRFSSWAAVSPGCPLWVQACGSAIAGSAGCRRCDRRRGGRSGTRRRRRPPARGVMVCGHLL